MFINALYRLCTDCGLKKSVDEFDVKYGRTYCNSCKNIRNANRASYKRAVENPEKYVICNSCTRAYSHQNRKWYKENCRYCESENVEPWN